MRWSLTFNTVPFFAKEKSKSQGRIWKVAEGDEALVKCIP